MDLKTLCSENSNIIDYSETQNTSLNSDITDLGETQSTSFSKQQHNEQEGADLRRFHSSNIADRRELTYVVFKAATQRTAGS